MKDFDRQATELACTAASVFAVAFLAIAFV